MNSGLISSYWKKFEEYSEYKILLDGKFSQPLIQTKNGEKIVGAIIRSKSSNGSLLLLPDLKFDSEEFSAEDEESETGLVWTQKGLEFGNKFISSIVALDKTIKKQSQITPIPEWANNPVYALPAEKKINQSLLKLEAKLEELQSEKVKLTNQREEEVLLKALLYEKSKILEYAILNALTLLGFSTSQYHDSDSEFDVIFESPEGRLLGEVEGKDNKPIKIDKLRQLEMNIHEDFSRDEIKKVAKGVLFGNAFRLDDLDNRSDFFTSKCITAASRSGVALVRTPDLFLVAQFLSEKLNKNFAKKCRKAILETSGEVVNFPEITKAEKASQKIKVK